MYKRFCGLAVSALALTLVSPAFGTPFTTTSPTGGALPSGVSAVGGVVVDLQGLNGTRIVSQVAASTEFVGQPSSGAYPLLFATQNGFDATVVGALGGGITSAAFRITLYDGDNEAGDFDYNDNTLLVNGINFGNFSAVATQQTNGTGTTVISSGSGFGDDILGTGWFSSTNAALLGSFYNTLSSGMIQFRVADIDPGDQYYDFAQGLDSSVINVGSGPVVTPPPTGAVPEPATWAMMVGGFGLVGSALRRRTRTSTRFA